MHSKTMVSSLLGRSRVFPDSLPASCGELAPFRLCSHSQPQFSLWDLNSEPEASTPSSALSQWVSRQASHAGECWSAPILCEEISRFALCTPVAGLSFVALKLHPWHLPSLTVNGLPTVWKLFLLHSSFPVVQVLFLFFYLCFFFYFCPTQVHGEFLPFGRSEVFCQHSVVVL